MDSAEKKKTLSVVCSIIGIGMALFGLTLGIDSIGADGMSGLGVIFILPSLIAVAIGVIDILIAVDKIKKGLIYSIIVSIIKCIFIIMLIPLVIENFLYELQHGYSNLSFDLILLVLLIVITIPSILNVLKLWKKRK